jgi:hypothetical protein
MERTVTLFCRCGVALTRPLLRTHTLLQGADRQPLVPANSSYVVEPGFTAWNGPAVGDHLLNRVDLLEGSSASHQPVNAAAWTRRYPIARPRAGISGA